MEAAIYRCLRIFRDKKSFFFALIYAARPLATLLSLAISFTLQNIAADWAIRCIAASRRNISQPGR